MLFGLFGAVVIVAILFALMAVLAVIMTYGGDVLRWIDKQIAFAKYRRHERRHGREPRF